MKHKTAGVVVMMTFMVIVSALIVCSPDSDATDGGSILLDHGNGDTHWSEGGHGTYAEVLTEAVGAAGSELTLGEKIGVDGLVERTIGTVHSYWHIYSWTDGEWTDVTETIDTGSTYDGTSIALGFYPDGMEPVETPTHKSSWTMFRGDSSNSGAQDAEVSEQTGSYAWVKDYGSNNFVSSGIMVEGDRVYVVAGGGHSSKSPEPTLYCYDRHTMDVLWSFTYDRGAGYETATGLIAGDRYYLPASNGTIYAIPLDGPGVDDRDVISLTIPTSIDHELQGVKYYTGPSTLIYDSGVLYFGSSNGYVYCIDIDLEIIWKTAVDGCIYYNAPTVNKDHLFIGTYDGHIYMIDRTNGEIEDKAFVFEYTTGSGEASPGSVNTPVIVGNTVIVSYSDGRGMDALLGGIVGFSITDGGLKRVFEKDTGVINNFLLPVETDGFQGVYFMGYENMSRVSISGVLETLVTGLGSFKAPITLVNGTDLYVPQYDRGGNIYHLSLDGKVLGKIAQPTDIEEYCMVPLTVVSGSFYLGTDCGASGYDGGIITTASSGGSSWWIIAALIVLILVAALALYKYRSKFVPKGRTDGSSQMSKVRRNKRRLAIVLAIGLILGFIIFIVSLAVGPSGNYGFFETISLLGSAISKTITGAELTQDEIFIFESRCSRVVAAFAVGVGLSISGSIYQAIIRNPMVDPYIMGVSAGAGVAAIATIAFNFTFFGLIDNITFVTPIAAIIGGVIAFGCTMLLAEKAGGTSLNYVLAGVIIGLVFSAIQTLMLSMSGDKLNDSMNWLFGSFANIDWTKALLVLFPALAMSLVPLIWAKEFNLVLLGEDQARQMGLDVRRFNRWMLILASVLASICVAFVGIIGFVGLVVPHFCRMLLGGDHRLVMPASIVVGGAMMMAADLFSKMVMIPMELPVGAITTVIGAPVFAYLLIKKGRMYDG